MKAWELERMKGRTVLGSTCLRRASFLACLLKPSVFGRASEHTFDTCVTLSIVLCRVVPNRSLSCLKEVQMPWGNKFLASLGEADTSLRLSFAELFGTCQFQYHLFFPMQIVKCSQGILCSFCQRRRKF